MIQHVVTSCKRTALSLRECALVFNRRPITNEDLPNLPYTEATVYEVLRMFPPAVLTPRVSSADTKVRV